MTRAEVIDGFWIVIALIGVAYSIRGYRRGQERLRSLDRLWVRGIGKLTFATYTQFSIANRGYRRRHSLRIASHGAFLAIGVLALTFAIHGPFPKSSAWYSVQAILLVALFFAGNGCQMLITYFDERDEQAIIRQFVGPIVPDGDTP